MSSPALQARTTVRCAIYTRKSTEEGLEQEFNTLDAQREAAEAYIASQRHEGWECLPDRFDDGGFTGGNTERPALQRLLNAIEAKRVDCVIVYKVDRLSRSLLDFSRLMDVFDRHNVSFVSVTQQFNTTHSMGRLTLNILLSFAQFEREIIAERTKDKMSAARRKGKWVGGIPVLGYDIQPDGGKLVVNDDEAAQVRAIFQLYLEHQGLVDLAQELNSRGWRSKRWVSAKGKVHGGKLYSKNIIARILHNVAYIGKVEYEGSTYAGEHEAIISDDLWTRVQRVLAYNSRTGGKDIRNRYGALLRGLLYCIPCNAAMSHTISSKNKKHYRYYVCQGAQQKGWKSCPSKSLNAHDIEQAVVEHIRGISSNSTVIQKTFMACQEKITLQLQMLQDEQQMLQKRIQKAQELLCDANVIRNPERIVGVHEQIQQSEQRLSGIIQEKVALEKGMFTEGEIASALTSFAPVWDSLTPHEQSKLISLLIERVGFDGNDGSVSVQFRSLQLQQLCNGGSHV